MRVLTLEDGIIVSVKYMTPSYVLLGNELVSDEGELGQRIHEDGTFEDVPVEPIEPQPTLEEKLARMERQLEEQGLVQLEVLATIYEELLMKG